jgi:large subunit ribosomal protein L25
MADTLEVSVRRETGTGRMRRLRRAGLVPAILYGHGEENVNLAVPASKLVMLVNHGVQTVKLSGEVDETVLIREVQWDAFGIDILHVDFLRVSSREKVEATVAVELRGEAPGAKEGGMLEQLLHQFEIECPAMSIPERLEVNINELGLGDSVRAAELELPPGATLLTDPDRVVVQCVEVAPAEEEIPVPAAAEPEVIGRDEGEGDQQSG